MNKVAKYLNEHLSGEVASQDFALSQVEVDNGLLARRPEMIVRAANMNDIRKVMRFCSQLAEKGHVLPVFVRGCGNDETGAATNKGSPLVVFDREIHWASFVLKTRPIGGSSYVRRARRPRRTGCACVGC